MEQSSIEKRIDVITDGIDKLPSLPSIVTKLIEVLNSPDSSADDAAKLLEKDPALTGRMLRLANSAFYGMPRTVSSVSSAVVILGFNTIRTVAFSATLFQMFRGSKQPAGFDKIKFWKHSIVSAMAAKAIVKRCINILMLDPESAFCAGILHDIGKLIFEAFCQEDYLKACQTARQHNISLVEAEKQVLGINHCELGKYLADKWALPLDLEYALVFHHEPGSADRMNEIVAAIHQADIMAHEVGAGLWEEEVLPEFNEKTRSVLRLAEAEYMDLLKSLEETIEKSNEYLNIISM